MHVLHVYKMVARNNQNIPGIISQLLRVDAKFETEAS